MLGSLAVGLAFLWAVDGIESDTFSMVVVQNLNGVAVQDSGPFVLGRSDIDSTSIDQAIIR